MFCRIVLISRLVSIYINCKGSVYPEVVKGCWGLYSKNRYVEAGSWVIRFTGWMVGWGRFDF